MSQSVIPLLLLSLLLQAFRPKVALGALSNKTLKILKILPVSYSFPVLCPVLLATTKPLKVALFVTVHRSLTLSVPKY
jgi:hypothetical protein